MSLVVHSFGVVSPIGVGSLDISLNRGTFVGFYFGLLVYVMCSVSIGVPFFLILYF